jgi:hypothetical protein
MAALPKALAARGHRVMVVVPHYQPYEGVRDTGVRLRLRCFDSLQEVRLARVAGWRQGLGAGRAVHYASYSGQPPGK